MKASDFLHEHIKDDDDLLHVFMLLLEAVRELSDHLDITTGYGDSFNVHQEHQLAIDIQSNIVIKEALAACDCISELASEEEENVVQLGGQRFSVAFDPLDGSSLVDANLSVGSIFGIYEGRNFIGKSGNDLAGAFMAIYGPRTTVFLSFGTGVYEFILKEEGFVLRKPDLKIAKDGAYFAPGNLRAAASETWYMNLVMKWINEKLTLRYSGGLCPDVGHILVKGSGIFTYPSSPDAPNGKLRLLYECAPIAYLIEQAGGKASDGNQRILDIEIESLHQKTPIFIGSCNQVDQALECFAAN